MNVALVHYWLVNRRGGEKVLESIGDLFPEADIYTHVLGSSYPRDTLTGHKIKKTLISNLPNAESWYQRYLPLMPLALEQLDMSNYELVISSESGPSKGIICRPDAIHICYCHSPMRYIWDMYKDYLQGKGAITAGAMKLAFHYLRIWDVTSAARVDHFIANSNYVAKRIEKYYRRTSTVIYPPVNVAATEVCEENDGYYLWLGQLVKYKRLDLAVSAFNLSGKELIVIGEGEEGRRLSKCSGTNIHFLGRQSDDAIHRYLARCRALVFPGVEDFGIVPIEAMAHGKPVVAFGAGGALETVVDGETGVLFSVPTAEALNAAIDKLEHASVTMRPERIRAQAELFDKSIFESRMQEFVDQALRHR